MGHNLLRRFGTSDKTMLFSTVLVVLLITTPNADAQRCNRWNTCYKQIQQQENSALKETFKEINRSLISLEHEKSEMNNTIHLLENMVYEQAKQISKLVETYSDSKEIEQATEQKNLIRTTTTQTSTTQMKKYKLKVVAKQR